MQKQRTTHHPVFLQRETASHASCDQPATEPCLPALHLGDCVYIVSPTKPFRGAMGVICTIEQERWRIAPYWLYQVELPVGVVGYEYGELLLISRRETEEAR